MRVLTDKKVFRYFAHKSINIAHILLENRVQHELEYNFELVKPFH